MQQRAAHPPFPTTSTPVMSAVLRAVFRLGVMFAAVALSGKNHSFHIRFCHLASSVLDSHTNPPPADSKTSCTEGSCSRNNTSVDSTSDTSPESLRNRRLRSRGRYLLETANRHISTCLEVGHNKLGVVRVHSSCVWTGKVLTSKSSL